MNRPRCRPTLLCLCLMSTLGWGASQVEAATLFGTVTDYAESTGILGAEIVVLDDRGEIVQEARTLLFGAYRIDELPSSGNVTVRWSGVGYQTSDQIVELTEEEIELNLHLFPIVPSIAYLDRTADRLQAVASQDPDDFLVQASAVYAMVGDLPQESRDHLDQRLLGSLGLVQGQVSDGEGASLPGVVVYLQSETGGVDRVAITSSDGSFNFGPVNQGGYSVTFEHVGFSTFKAEDFEVYAGRFHPISLVLGDDPALTPSEVPIQDAGLFFDSVPSPAFPGLTPPSAFPTPIPSPASGDPAAALPGGG